MAPLKEITSEAIVTALRHRVLPIGLGKPGLFLLDGGPEFKSKLRSAIKAWDSKAHVHAPHHHESAGVIEIFNRTIEKKISLLKYKTKLNWYDVYMDALDVYNAAPHNALSDGSTTILSPAEVFLGRALQYAWDIPENADNTETVAPSKHDTDLKERATKVRAFVVAAREDYLKSLEASDKNANHEFRTFEVGDEVTKYAPTEKKRIDKVSPLQQGPYTVVKLGTSLTDYLVQQQGTSKAPEWVHVDRIKRFRLKKDTAGEASEISPAKPHAKLWELCMIAGEQGKTRGTKQYRILWSDKTVTWDPEKNLYHAAEASKAWTELSEASKLELKGWNKEKLWEVYQATILEKDVTYVGPEAESEVNLIHDVSTSAWTMLIQEVHSCSVN